VGAAGWVWALMSIGCIVIVVTLEKAISVARIYIISVLVITDILKIKYLCWTNNFMYQFYCNYEGNHFK
jgi:hypothetical protein